MEFQIFHLSQSLFVAGIHFFLGGLPFLLEFMEHFHVFDNRFRIPELVDPLFVALELFQNYFGPFGIIPEGGINGLLFLVFDL